MIAGASWELLQTYNRTIQDLNRDPSRVDYKKKVEEAQDSFRKGILELVNDGNPLDNHAYNLVFGKQK